MVGDTDFRTKGIEFFMTDPSKKGGKRGSSECPSKSSAKPRHGRKSPPSSENVQEPPARSPAEYEALLRDLKKRVHEARLRAGLAVNRELVLLYWKIGHSILERQSKEGWGAKIIDLLSRDLRLEFPDMKGFSPRNLKYMRAFAEAYPDQSFVQEALAQMTWYHNLTLLEKVKDPAVRFWYTRKTIEHGWSRNILALQIESGLHLRQGKAVTNFKATLPEPHSDLAQEALKDPYLFDFLSLSESAKEHEIQKQLIHHLRRFLLELGAGMAFVGEQVRLEVEGQDFWIDLLFYHLRLRCYVVIELKTGPFKPEYAGQLNFYLSAVDDQWRHPDDKASIGLLLCRSKNRLTVEYALRDLGKPIGVAAWKTKLVESLPQELKGTLPTVEEIEAEFDRRKRRLR